MVTLWDPEKGIAGYYSMLLKCSQALKRQFVVHNQGDVAKAATLCLLTC